MGADQERRSNGKTSNVRLLLPDTTETGDSRAAASYTAFPPSTGSLRHVGTGHATPGEILGLQGWGGREQAWGGPRWSVVWAPELLGPPLPCALPARSRVTQGAPEWGHPTMSPKGRRGTSGMTSLLSLPQTWDFGDFRRRKREAIH